MWEKKASMCLRKKERRSNENYNKYRKRFRVSNKVKSASKDRLRLKHQGNKKSTAQIIDDIKNITVVSASSVEKDIKSISKNKSELSKIVAEKLAKKAQEKKISKIYFDRGIYKYPGRIKFLLKLFVKMEWNFDYGK